MYLKSTISNYRFIVLTHRKVPNIMDIHNILLKIILHHQQDKVIHSILHDHLVDTCLHHLDLKDHLLLINMEVMVINHPHNKLYEGSFLMI